MKKLYYITGVPGSGKSSVLRELQTRGYEAHGVDEEGFADWHNKATGSIDVRPEDQTEEQQHQWFGDHDWTLNRDRIAALKLEVEPSLKNVVFLCGVAGGEKEVWDLFDGVFALIIDAETLKKRISNRTDNHFGKSEDELNLILSGHATYETDYKGFGATIIDATQPINIVTDEILCELQ
jgi:thymidylate kinase